VKLALKDNKASKVRRVALEKLDLGVKLVK
jgi:hypothetical protein